MTINSLRDLKQVIKALREGGVTAAEIDGVKLTLLPKSKTPVSKLDLTPDYSRDIPEAAAKIQYTPINPHTGSAFETIFEGDISPNDTLPEELTEEQRMFYSSAQ